MLVVSRNVEFLDRPLGKGPKVVRKTLPCHVVRS
jgi:hypothetical protein